MKTQEEVTYLVNKEYGDIEKILSKDIKEYHSYYEFIIPDLVEAINKSIDIKLERYHYENNR